jgi:hypothetical protein
MYNSECHDNDNKINNNGNDDGGDIWVPLLPYQYHISIISLKKQGNAKYFLEVAWEIFPISEVK